MGFVMDLRVIVSAVLLVLCVTSANAQPAALTPTSTPAPAPAPEYVNLTHLLAVAGPFNKFLSYLQSTKVIDTFQNQANNTDEGITLFVPRDQAFESQKKRLSNLTQDQLKSICLFHALPHYYELSDFKNLSQQSPIPTFAGGQYSLNFTDNSGTVHVDSGWTKTKITSAVRATDPVAIYETDRVLLPEAIFGTDIPPTPAPAPSPVPDVAPAADSPAQKEGNESSSSSPNSSPSSSHRALNLGIMSHLALAFAGGMLMFS